MSFQQALPLDSWVQIDLGNWAIVSALMKIGMKKPALESTLQPDVRHDPNQFDKLMFTLLTRCDESSLDTLLNLLAQQANRQEQTDSEVHTLIQRFVRSVIHLFIMVFHYAPNIVGTLLASVSENTSKSGSLDNTGLSSAYTLSSSVQPKLFHDYRAVAISGMLSLVSVGIPAALGLSSSVDKKDQKKNKIIGFVMRCSRIFQTLLSYSTNELTGPAGALAPVRDGIVKPTGTISANDDITELIQQHFDGEQRNFFFSFEMDEIDDENKISEDSDENPTADGQKADYNNPTNMANPFPAEADEEEEHDGPDFQRIQKKQDEQDEPVAIMIVNKRKLTEEQIGIPNRDREQDLGTHNEVKALKRDYNFRHRQQHQQLDERKSLPAISTVPLLNAAVPAESAAGMDASAVAALLKPMLVEQQQTAAATTDAEEEAASTEADNMESIVEEAGDEAIVAKNKRTKKTKSKEEEQVADEEEEQYQVPLVERLLSKALREENVGRVNKWMTRISPDQIVNALERMDMKEVVKLLQMAKTEMRDNKDEEKLKCWRTWLKEALCSRDLELAKIPDLVHSILSPLLNRLERRALLPKRKLKTLRKYLAAILTKSHRNLLYCYLKTVHSFEELKEVTVENYCKYNTVNKCPAFKKATLPCTRKSSRGGWCPFSLMAERNAEKKFHIYAHSEHNHPLKPEAERAKVRLTDKNPPEQMHLNRREFKLLNTVNSQKRLIKCGRQNGCVVDEQRVRKGNKQLTMFCKSKSCSFKLFVGMTELGRYHVYYHSQHTCSHENVANCDTNDTNGSQSVKCSSDGRLERRQKLVSRAHDGPRIKTSRK